MPSRKISLVNGEIYHIYNRGAGRQDIFFDKRDYLRFYESLIYFNSPDATGALRLAKSNYDPHTEKLVECLAYCVLPNHYHLILRQISDSGISEYIQKVSTGYTSFFNERYERNGVLFQGKFKRVHVENESQFNYLVAYVNHNYTVHHAAQPEDVCYSSLPVYQKTSVSKLVKINADTFDYTENKLLACDINRRREFAKAVIE